jgi:hypothetical protein
LNEYNLYIEMSNGLKKSFEITHNQLLEFQMLIKNEENSKGIEWFSLGTTEIRLAHVSIYRYNSI